MARGSSWHAWVLGRGVTSAVQLEERQRGAGAAQRRRGAIGSPPHRNWRIGQLLIHGFVRFALLGPGPLCYMLETKCDVLLDLLHSIKSMRVFRLCGCLAVSRTSVLRLSIRPGVGRGTGPDGRDATEIGMRPIIQLYCVYGVWLLM